MFILYIKMINDKEIFEHFRPDFSVIKNFQKVFWVFNFGHFFCPFSET